MNKKDKNLNPKESNESNESSSSNLDAFEEMEKILKNLTDSGLGNLIDKHQFCDQCNEAEKKDGYVTVCLHNQNKKEEQTKDQKKSDKKSYTISELNKKLDEDIDKDPNNPKHYFTKAKLLKLMNKLNTAIVCTDKCIELAPKNAEYLCFRASLHEIQGDYKDALNFYLKASIAEPENKEPLFNLASLSQRMEKYDDSLNFISKYIKVSELSREKCKKEKAEGKENKESEEDLDETSDFMIYDLQGICLKKKGDFKNALNAYEKSIELYDKNYNTLFNKGVLHQDLQEYELAKECYIKANSTENIINNFAYVNLAAIYKLEGNIEEERKCYEKALTIDSSDNEILLPYGSTLEASGQYEKALEIFNNFLIADNKNNLDYVDKVSDSELENKNKNAKNKCNNKVLYPSPELHYFIGNCLKKINRIDDALIAYSNSLKLKKDFDAALIAKANILVQLEKNEIAMEILDNVLNENPDDLGALINKGTALQGMSLYQQSLDCFKKVIELNPNISDVYSGQGLNYMNLNNKKEAIENFKKALNLNENNATAIWNLGCCYVDEKEFDNAIKCFEKFNLLQPDNYSALNALGMIYINDQKFNEALQKLNRSIELNKNCANSFFYKGVALQNLKEYEDAIECYDIVLHLEPKHEEAKKMKKSIWEELKKLTRKED